MYLINHFFEPSLPTDCVLDFQQQNQVINEKSFLFTRKSYLFTRKVNLTVCDKLITKTQLIFLKISKLEHWAKKTSYGQSLYEQVHSGKKTISYQIRGEKAIKLGLQSIIESNQTSFILKKDDNLTRIETLDAILSEFKQIKKRDYLTYWKLSNNYLTDQEDENFKFQLMQGILKHEKTHNPKEAKALIAYASSCNFKNPESLLEIVKSCIDINCETTMYEISSGHFSIKETQLIKSIINYCKPTLSELLINSTAKNKVKSIAKLYLGDQWKKDVNLKEKLKDIFGDPIEPYLSSIEDKNRPSLIFLAYAFIYYDLLESTRIKCQEEPIIKAFLELRSPIIRKSLLSSLIVDIPEHFSSLKKSAPVSQLEHKESRGSQPKRVTSLLALEKSNQAFPLLRLLLAHLGFSQLEQIEGFYRSSNLRFIKKGTDLANLLAVLNELKNKLFLTQEKKQMIVTTLMNSQNLKVSIVILQTYLQLNKIDNLKEPSWLENGPSYFLELFPDEIRSLPNFEELHGKFFVSSRHPLALLIYASHIKALKQPQACSVLKDYVQHTFEGTLSTFRHSLNSNSHLQMVNSSSSTVFKKWQENISLGGVEETEDPIDLLVFGEDIGSCQSPKADIEKSRGLLGPLSNGKIHLLVIRDSDSKTIKARCFLKLLLDKQSNIVLFLEKFYFLKRKEHASNAKLLLDAAKYKARQLKVPLLTSYSTLENKSYKPYRGKIFSYAGPAPYEHTDAGANDQDFGIKENGDYDLSNLYLID